jgi:hypothetical protein
MESYKLHKYDYKGNTKHMKMYPIKNKVSEKRINYEIKKNFFHGTANSGCNPKITIIWSGELD